MPLRSKPTWPRRCSTWGAFWKPTARRKKRAPAGARRWRRSPRWRKGTSARRSTERKAPIQRRVQYHADRGGKLGKTCVGLEGCFLTRRRGDAEKQQESQNLRARSQRRSRGFAARRARQWKTDQRREEQERHKQAVCRCVGSGPHSGDRLA